ncbi:MAG: glycosyltransferase family A protein [Chloroflexota bacterium]
MISIIIPAYNAEKTLGSCLQALKAQTVQQPYEIIVVDDASIDQTAAVAQQHSAILLKLPQNRGAAAARNLGLKHAQGDIICFTDADCLPRPNWLEQMIQPFDNPEIIGCKGIYETQQTEWVARFVQIEYEDKYDLLKKAQFIDFIDTYSAAYRKSHLLKHDGFDERIFYVEDQELSFRLAAEAYKMVFQPAAIVGHVHSNTLSKYVRKKFMIGYWKSQIIRRFPSRAIKDSHTPQTLKLQILLVALILIALGLVVFSTRLWFLPAVGTLGFVLTTIPFIAKAWPKDKIIALLSPILLFCRALGLGFGTARGFVQRLPHIETIKSSLAS